MDDHDQNQPSNLQNTVTSTVIPETEHKKQAENEHSNLQDGKDKQTPKEITSIEFNVDQIKTEPDCPNDNDLDNDTTTYRPYIEMIKRRMKRELQRLGVGLKEEIEEFDAFGDNVNVYKKYKLRDGQRKMNYRIPMDIPYLQDTKKPKTQKDGKSTDNKQNNQCSKCNKKFPTLYQMRLHYKAQHFNQFTCSQCSLKFDTNQELKYHKIIHKNDCSYLCHECKLAFTDHCDFQIHELTHFGPNFKHTCLECGLTYAGKSAYQAHILTHFDRPMSCPICSKTVNGEHRLQLHVNNHNLNVKCVECGKVLCDKKSYKDHLAIHTGVKRYQCLYCGKCFRTLSQKKIHTRCHTKERLFNCDICDRPFLDNITLIRHKKKHNGTKNYNCDVCDKKFLHEKLLSMHKRMHSKHKLIQCPECDIKLTTFSGLKTHVLFKHTTERVVKCELCDKSFINKNQFDKHARSKYHKRNVYKTKLENQR